MDFVWYNLLVFVDMLTQNKIRITSPIYILCSGINVEDNVWFSVIMYFIYSILSINQTALYSMYLSLFRATSSGASYLLTSYKTHVLRCCECYNTNNVSSTSSTNTTASGQSKRKNGSDAVFIVVGIWTEKYHKPRVLRCFVVRYWRARYDIFVVRFCFKWNIIMEQSRAEIYFLYFYCVP